MGKFIDWFNENLYKGKRLDGEFQLIDLLNLPAVINAIGGSDRRSQSSDGKFQFGDLTNLAGIIDALKGEDRTKVENELTGVIDGILGTTGSENPLEHTPGTETETTPGTETETTPGTETETTPGTETETTPENGNSPIIDGTDTNTGIETVTPMDWIAKIEEWRDNDREREDQIRAETQQREDTAWQRGIEDLRKSGANINLIGAQPAESGGGITNATGVDASALTTGMKNELEEMLTILDQDFQGSEKDKDRLLKTVSNLITIIGLMKLKAK